jgi:acyl carrier protein
MAKTSVADPVTQGEWSMKEDIKSIVAQILYLSGPEQVADSASLFRELNMSSIDYVDLCYELKDKVDNRISLENLVCLIFMPCYVCVLASRTPVTALTSADVVRIKY